MSERDIKDFNKKIKNNMEMLNKAEKNCNYKNYKMALQRIENYKKIIVEIEQQMEKIRGWDN